MNKLRIGVAGAGNIATSRHIPAYQNNDHAHLAAIYDTDAGKARRVGNTNDLLVVDSFDELLTETDLVSLCTPPSVHRDQAVTALESGCHVLSEKPMAMSVSEATDMIDAAAANDRVLSVVHNFRFMKSIREAVSLVERGAIGDVVRTQAFLVKKEGEGKEYVAEAERNGNEGIRFWDEAPHMMYLTRAFIGNMDLDEATATQFPNQHGYRSIRARFSGEDDTLGGITFFWDSPVSEWWLVVFGTDGLIAIDIYRDLLLQFDAESEHSAVRVISILAQAVGQASVGGFTAGLRYLRDRFVDGYRIPDAGFSYQIHRVVDAVHEGSAPPVTGAESRAVLEDMYAVSEATGLSI